MNQQKKSHLFCEEPIRVVNTPYEEKLMYSAQIMLPSEECIAIQGSLDGKYHNISSPIVFDLFFSDGSRCDKRLLISKIEVSQGDASVKLELIEVPENLRRLGIATIVFGSWIKLLEKFSEIYGIQISRIYGIVGENGNFTPQCSTPLYKHFNDYQCFNGARLLLNSKELRNRSLEYQVKRAYGDKPLLGTEAL